MSHKKNIRQITVTDLATAETQLRDLAKSSLDKVRGGGESPDLKYKYKY